MGLPPLVGGANEPEPGEAAAEMYDELQTAQRRIAAVEREVNKWRIEVETVEARERALQGERDDARVAEAAEREKRRIAISEAENSARAAQAAQERAEAAEIAIKQAKALPGIKGRLIRWLASDVLN
ncbi:MAG: hypothetical protein PHT60_14190 [Acidiphilium sp.]|nr:hypothetical protein [Acidiphilium sp.]MDD4936912.1 hypothetical protein [Acidiphilium sp.]